MNLHITNQLKQTSYPPPPSAPPPAGDSVDERRLFIVGRVAINEKQVEVFKHFPPTYRQTW